LRVLGYPSIVIYEADARCSTAVRADRRTRAPRERSADQSEDRQRVGIVDMYDVTDVELSETNSAVDRRRNRGIAELHSSAVYRGAIGTHRRPELPVIGPPSAAGEQFGAVSAPDSARGPSGLQPVEPHPALSWRSPRSMSPSRRSYRFALGSRPVEPLGPSTKLTVVRVDNGRSETEKRRAPML
jgi:hypothetical protein